MTQTCDVDEKSSEYDSKGNKYYPTRILFKPWIFEIFLRNHITLVFQIVSQIIVVLNNICQRGEGNNTPMIFEYSRNGGFFCVSKFDINRFIVQLIRCYHDHNSIRGSFEENTNVLVTYMMLHYKIEKL